jgi:hypothetical protein
MKLFRSLFTRIVCVAQVNVVQAFITTRMVSSMNTPTQDRTGGSFRMLQQDFQYATKSHQTEHPLEACRSTHISASTYSRRTVFSAVTAAATTLLVQSPVQAFGLQQRFPDELSIQDAIILEAPARTVVATPQQHLSLVGCLVWGAALWFLTGSRSNPLVTPLANALYDANDEAWLQDRNDGLFANLPISLFAVLVVVFVLLGSSVDALFLFSGNHSASIQFSIVTLIGAGSLEIGRIASGEKKVTRAEFNRNVALDEDFASFATKRFLPGGNVHRSEVVAAFRRFHSKYRQADNEEYPLSDLEIEKLLRNWSEQFNIRATSAGFYNGIKINQDADVFVKR